MNYLPYTCDSIQPRTLLSGVVKPDRPLLEIIKFLEDRCIVAPDENEVNKYLYTSYVEWCKTHKIAAVGKGIFGRYLVSLGMKAESMNGGYYRQGVSLNYLDLDAEPGELDLSDLIAYTKNLREQIDSTT